jgi:nucleotide-binding universal stress UspA family protein
MPYAHVLVAYDGSARGDDAIRTAARLARDAGAQLTVAAVVELAAPCRTCGAPVGMWNIALREHAGELLTHARTLVDMPAHMEILCGPPQRALTDGARGLGCDAIVLPARRRPLARLLGRRKAPRSVRRHAHCEVLQLQ